MLPPGGSASKSSNEFVVYDGQSSVGSVGNLTKQVINIKPSSLVSHNNNNTNTRKQSSSSTSSSSSSSTTSDSFDDMLTATTPPPINKQHSTEFVYFDEIADNPNSLVVKFKCSLSDEKEVEWKTLLVNGVLYVDIPSSVLPKGSRDSFVSLLEFAEEKLDCHKVYVCFKRNRPDRTSLMRVFMFFGFTVVPPGNPQVPQSDDIMSMVYNIE